LERLGTPDLSGYSEARFLQDLPLAEIQFSLDFPGAKRWT
jgi:hypothetical protein